MVQLVTDGHSTVTQAGARREQQVLGTEGRACAVGVSE